MPSRTMAASAHRRRAQFAYWGALTLVLVLGLWLRARGYWFAHSDLWGDEATWANRLLLKPLLELGIRPIGYMAACRFLVDTFGVSEFWLRFLSNVSSMAALCLAPYIASRLLPSRAVQVLFVLVFALHPALIDFSKEFKPYSLEVLVHMVPLALYLRYQQQGTPSFRMMTGRECS